MLEPGDIGISVGSLAVSNGYFHNLQVEFKGTEDEIKVAKGIKISEEFPVLD